MEVIKTTTDNNNTKVITEQKNINNSIIECDGRNIQILNDDCIISILLQVNTLVDLKNCKLINKRFLRVFNDATEVRNHLFFLKNCINPEMFLALPKNYILSINKQLASTTSTITADSKNVVTNQQHIAFKKKLFSRIEHNLLQAKEVALKNIATVEHQWYISNVAFSKDNNLFATASNTTVQIYQFVNDSWQLFSKLNHEEDIKQIIFSPDSNFIITTSISTHKIWSLFGSDFPQTIENYYSASIIFRDDSKRFFFTGQSLDEIKVFDFINNNWKEVFTIKNNELNQCFNISDGTFLDQPQIPQNIKEDKWLAFVIKRYTVAPKYNASFKFGDKNLAFKVRDILYSYTWGDVKEMYNCGIQYIDYSNDMKLIYVCAKSSLILEYVNSEWQLKFRFPYKISQPLGFSADNQRLISHSFWSDEKLYTITVWNIASNEPYEEITLNDASMAQFSKDGKYIVVTDRNKQVTIWYFVDGAWRIKASIKYDYVVDEAIFSNYNWMIATLSYNKATISELINISETTIGSNALITDNNISFNEIIKLTQVNNIFFSATNNYFATISGKLAKIWRITTNGCESLSSLEHEDNITNILFNRDNSHVIISSTSHTNIWGITVNKYSKQLTIETQEQPYIDLKDDGSKILIAEEKKLIQTFTLINDNWEQNFIINKLADIFAIQQGNFILNQFLAQDNNDSWVIFALQRYAIVTTARHNKNDNLYLPAHRIIPEANTENVVNFKQQIQDFIYSANHKATKIFGLPDLNIVSYSQDKKLIYFGFEKDDCVILENDNNQWRQKSTFYGGIAQADFSPDNQRIVTISNKKRTNKQMIIWNIASDNTYQELRLNNINSAKFSQDNKYLVTLSSANNIVKIWMFIDEHWQVQHSITTDDNPNDIKFSKDLAFLSIVYENHKIKIYQLLED